MLRLVRLHHGEVSLRALRRLVGLTVLLPPSCGKLRLLLEDIPCRQLFFRISYSIKYLKCYCRSWSARMKSGFLTLDVQHVLRRCATLYNKQEQVQHRADNDSKAYLSALMVSSSRNAAFLWLRKQNEVYHNCSFLSSATKSSSVVPVSFSAFSTLFIASSIDAGPKRGSETLVCVFPFNVVNALILLLYITDVFANLLIISFTTNFLFQKLLQSGKTNKAVKDGLKAQ